MPNIIGMIANQLGTRSDNVIKDTENLVDIATEEGYGILDYAKDVQRRFYNANRRLLDDVDKIIEF